jgi:hypothetical protein
MKLPMRAAVLAISAMAFAQTAGSPASATTVYPEEFTCTVGGEKFEDFVVGSYTSWGQRPDGRAYGTLPVMPVIECPANGFPIYRDEFTPAEVQQLTPLVESEPFQALRKAETPHYRVWWLMNEMGEPPVVLARTLLVASWETDEDPGRKSRYQGRFVEAAAAIPPAQGED